MIGQETAQSSYKAVVFLTGLATEPVDGPYLAGEPSVVISLAAQVYLATESAARTGAEIRWLPVTGDRFTLDGVDLPLPTFGDAEALVDEMIGAGLLKSDDLVARAFSTSPKAASKRSRPKRSTAVSWVD